MWPAWIGPLKVTMSRKSSIPQDAKSVTVVLMPDRAGHRAEAGGLGAIGMIGVTISVSGNQA
jgi:hypothetical protein